MNTVYVLSIHHNDDGAYIVGIFSSKEKALQYAKSECLGTEAGGYGGIEVDEYTVDVLL